MIGNIGKYAFLAFDISRGLDTTPDLSSLFLRMPEGVWVYFSGMAIIGNNHKGVVHKVLRDTRSTR